MGIGCDGNDTSEGESVHCRDWNRGLTIRLLKLVTTDGKETEIVKFHRARLLPKKKKARLVIHPAGMEMLDYIVLTFVFVEYRRRQREAAAKSGGG